MFQKYLLPRLITKMVFLQWKLNDLYDLFSNFHFANRKVVDLFLFVFFYFSPSFGRQKLLRISSSHLWWPDGSLKSDRTRNGKVSFTCQLKRRKTRQSFHSDLDFSICNEIWDGTLVGKRNFLGICWWQMSSLVTRVEWLEMV